MKTLTHTRLRGLVAGAMALVLALGSPVAALADSLTGSNNWRVTYSDGSLNDNSSAREFADQVSGLQPGDDITFTWTLAHDASAPADWYMANDVVSTLEESQSAANGSAYGYLLTYSGPTRSVTLYDSSSLGGDNSSGLHDADSALADYFALETLSKGQTATVTLKVTLDGETEGNDYINTLAQLKMRFAVEPQPEGATRNQTTTGGNATDGTTTENGATDSNRSVVRTGDDTGSRLFPFYVAMVVSGLLFLVLAVQSLRLRKQDREEGLR